MTEFDIVIPLGPNDEDIIQKQIVYTKANVVGYRNIYIVTRSPGLVVDGCTIVSEDVFPFSIDTVAEMFGPSDRNGWFFQQLIKLYAGLCIPGILENYLVVDADTFFLRPVTFFEKGVPLYNVGHEHHHPYFSHMARMHPSLGRVHQDMSGICHHMMFNRTSLGRLFFLVEQRHGFTMPFWHLFLKMVENEHQHAAGASEYEMYFNFLIIHGLPMKIRRLSWANVWSAPTDANYDYVAWHWYSR